jgi:hypothetical protein
MPEYDDKEKDAYKTLKLPEGASRAEIKKQYHRLAREFHTDVNATGNEDKLKQANEAYEDLTNPAKIAGRQQAKRRAAAEQAQADAGQAAAEARAARRARQRSAQDAERFSEQLRGQTNATRPSTPEVPPTAPSPASPLWHVVPEKPPQVAPPVTGPRNKLGDIVLKLAFLAAPIGIMALVVPAQNAHPNLYLNVVSIVCFLWLIAGIAGLFIELD